MADATFTVTEIVRFPMKKGGFRSGIVELEFDGGDYPTGLAVGAGPLNGWSLTPSDIAADLEVLYSLAPIGLLTGPNVGGGTPNYGAVVQYDYDLERLYAFFPDSADTGAADAMVPTPASVSGFPGSGKLRLHYIGG